VPTYAVTAAFLRLFRKLTKQQRAAFLAARDLFIEELRKQGFTPPLHPSLRLHKLGGHNVWSISFGDGMRAVFRVADEVRPGETHIVWEFVGDHDAYDRAY
jgi:hypothetical protein